MRRDHAGVNSQETPNTAESSGKSGEGLYPKTTIPELASQLDLLEDIGSNIGLGDLLQFKGVKSFQEFFQVVKDGTELDIALVFLHQLLKGNRRLQNQIKEHTEVALDGFKSMEAAFVFVDDIVKTGAIQERKTTVMELGLW